MQSTMQFNKDLIGNLRLGSLSRSPDPTQMLTMLSAKTNPRNPAASAFVSERESLEDSQERDYINVSN